MSDIQLRQMTAADRAQVAELICISTNVWYQTHGRPKIFAGGPKSTAVFFDVYNAMEPGCGVVAVNGESGQLAGSCFYHPRPTHVSPVRLAQRESASSARNTCFMARGATSRSSCCAR